MKSRLLLYLCPPLLLVGLLFLNSVNDVAVPHAKPSSAVTQLTPVDDAKDSEVLQEAKMSALSVSLKGLDPIFKAVGGKNGLLVPARVFASLEGSVVGDEVTFPLGESELKGRLTSANEKEHLRRYVIELADNAGRALLTVGEDGFVGEVFFNGDSRMLQIRNYKKDALEPTLVVESGRIHEFYCAPVGTIYTERGLQIPGRAAGLIEPIPNLLSSFQGEPSPVALESRPGSENVLYLDFDGGVFGQEDSGFLPGLVAAEPHPMVNEESWVRAVHARVAEDFAPFDINVTTDRDVFDAADGLKRLHVVITPTDDAGPGLGGISRIGSFGDVDSPILWVFNHTEYGVASTVSHEAGHAFGLDDDGVADGEQYYGGHSDGYTPGWAPIMGAPWNDVGDAGAEVTPSYDEVDQWSKGAYTGADNDEDDLAIIASHLGYVADEYVERFEDVATPPVGKSVGTLAEGAEGAVNSRIFFRGEGLISTATDKDVFKINLIYDGPLNVRVSPLDIDAELEALYADNPDQDAYTKRQEVGSRTQGANLAVDIKLLDADGIVVASGTDDGDADLGSLIAKTDLTAGVYYLVVTGGGRGDASTGFDDYASLGKYEVEAEMSSGPVSVYGGSKKNVPVEQGSTSPESANGTDFGFLTVGSSATSSFLIKNTEDSGYIDVQDISLASGIYYSVSGLTIPSQISAGTAKGFSVAFAPTSGGFVAKDTVTITYYSYLSDRTETFSFDIEGTALYQSGKDNYEDNQTTTQATSLNGQEGVWLSEYKGLAFLGSDGQDYYTFTVDPNDDLITIHTQYDSTTWDNQFVLKMRKNNVFLDLDAVVGTDGNINYIIPAEYKGQYNLYYIRVDSTDPGSMENVYDLKWEAISLSGDEGDDLYGNSTQGTAFDLSSSSGRSLSQILGLGKLQSEDWYKITVDGSPYDRLLYIAADFDHSKGNIDIEVLTEDEYYQFFRYFPQVSEATDSDHEAITVAALTFLDDYVGDNRSPFENNSVIGVPPGTYYIRVYSDAYDTVDPQEYDLITELLSDDNYEVVSPGVENDLEQNAYDLGESIVNEWLSNVAGAGTIANYGSDPNDLNATFVNGGDTDWFEFTIPAGVELSRLMLDYVFVPDSGLMELVSSTGEVLASTTSSAGTLTLNNPGSAKTYRIHVVSDSTITFLSGYDFRVRYSNLPPDKDVEDNYEDNNVLDHAFDLSDYEGFSLASIDGYGYQSDPDWYKITIPEGATEVRVEIIYDSADGDLNDIRFREADAGAVPVYPEDMPNGKVLVWNTETSRPIESGEFAILVNGDDLGTPYNIVWTVTRGDDKYEENDDFDSAYDLTGNPRQWLSKVDGLGIQKDTDYYKIEVPAGSNTAQLQVRTYFDPSEGDIDLDLYYKEADGQYSWVANSVNTDEVEELTILNPLEGEYVVELHYGDKGNEYDLWWAPFTQAELDSINLANDLYEDNDTQATAYPLGGDEVILAGIYGQGTQSDDDWYAITVSDNNVGLDIECTFQPQNGDIDIELYDSLGGLLARSAKDDGPSGPFNSAIEDIHYGTFLPAGTYYIRVYGANLGNPYNLYWVERTPDIYEANDTLETAYNLVTEEQTISQVEGTQSNDDWFQIEVNSDTAYLSVDLEYVHYFGNIDFEIYDADGASVWASPSDMKPEVDALLSPFVESSFISVTSGTYYIRVFGGPATTYSDETPAFDTVAGNRWNSYTLNWTVNEDDSYESVDQNGVAIQNDTREALRDYTNDEGDPAKDFHPSDLTGADGVTISALRFDDDWYKVTLSPGNQFLSALIRYELALGDIDLELYDSTGSLLVASKTGERDPSEITEDAPATKEDNTDTMLYLAPDALGGVYYLKVTGPEPGTKDSNYQLVWEQGVGDDGYEENDDAASATLIPEDPALASLIARTSKTLSAHEFDDDWYQFTMNPGEVEFAVSLLFNHATGDLDFEVYDDPAGEPLAIADSRTDNEFLVFRPEPTGGTYYIRVFGDHRGNDYTIQWASSFVDIYEGSGGNNVIGDATDLRGQEALRMSEGLGYATAGDDDWYQIEIAPGDSGVFVEAYRDPSFGAGDGFNVELFNSSDQTVAFADGDDVTQRIRYDGPAGTYYVHVFGGLMGNPYDLFWNSYKEDVLESSGEGVKPEKPAEQNDVPNDPRGLQRTSMNEAYYPLVDGPQPDLELVRLDDLTQADEDWYTFYVDDEDTFLGEPADDILIVNLEFEHSQGDIDMALYYLGASGGDAPTLVDTLDGSGNVMGLSKTDNEQIRIDSGLQPGKYLLCVYGHGVEDTKPTTSPIVRTIDPLTDDTSGLGNTYSLRWNSGYQDHFDAVSPNNDRLSATDLGVLDDQSGPRELSERFLTQYDEDWYKIEVQSSTVHQLYARIDFEHIKGDLALRLYDSVGNLILVSDASTDTLDHELLHIFGSGTATYYLQVTGEDLGAQYNLYLRAYNDDIYEDNDEFESPADVRGVQENLMSNQAAGVENVPGTRFQRGIIHGVQLDDDYYLISVPKDSVHLYVDFFTDLGIVGDFDVGYQVLSPDEVPRSTAAWWYDLISPDASNYIIHVFGGDIGTSYDLYWEVDNVDEYDSQGGISYPNYYSNGHLDQVSQPSDNNTWENAYELTQGPRLEPSYNDKIPYKAPIRDLIYDEAVLQTRYSNVGNNQTLAVAHGTQLDDDWYRLEVPSWELVTAKKGNQSIRVLKRIYNTSLQIDLAYEHDDGEIHVEVYDVVDDMGDTDPSNDVLELVSPISLADDNDDLESIQVPVNPLDADHVYAIKVYGANAGNSYSLTWREDRTDLYESNNFVDRSHDLTLAYDATADTDSDGPAAADDLTDLISSEGKWLHEMWQHNDVNGNGTIEPGEMIRRGYGNQSTDDWYAVAVSAGADTLSVQANFYADDNTDHEYGPDDLDFAIDLYRLVDDSTLGIRKPILIGRINDNDKNTEPFPARVNPISGDLDYPLTEPGGSIDPDTGERIESASISLPDEDGGIYFIRIFYDNRKHPYTFKWDDVDTGGNAENPATDAAIVDDYLNGDWSYIPDYLLPEEILLGAGDSNGNGYPDWMEYALTLDPAQAAPGLTVYVQSTREIEVNGALDEYYVVSYLRSTEAVVLGYEFTVLETDDLLNPFVAAGEDQLISQEIVAPGVERVVYRSAVPVSDAASYFFQLDVAAP